MGDPGGLGSDTQATIKKIFPPLKNRPYPESSLAIDDYADDGGPVGGLNFM